jgi:hypothetical protein
VQKGRVQVLKIERPVENMQVYGDNTVVVTGNSRYTDVWVKGPKGWQMVVWQSTPIPAH